MMESVIFKDNIYFKEYESYSKEDILRYLGKNENVFKKLKESSIIDIENDSYKFNFVGIIVIGDYLIKCFPKYIPDKSNISDEDFKLVLNSIKRYNKSDGEFLYENEESEDVSFNLLSLMLFFIEDYYENGVYTNIKNILEVNGNGEINWDRTINGTFPLIKEYQPYYTELHTHRKIHDLYDYFRLLHEYVITKCSEDFEKYDLLNIFDLTPVELSDKILDDFGDIGFILERLEKELNIEFNTRKRILLKSMHRYFSEKNLFSKENLFTIYGVRKYEHIWEEMCSEVFDNKLDTQLMELNLEERINRLNLETDLKKYDLSDTKIEITEWFMGEQIITKYNLGDTLKDLIEKPNWVLNEGDSKSTDTYILDIISISDDNFIILDAKYYDLKFYKDEHGKIILDGSPGIESITKQHFYELEYKKFINDFRFKAKNAFLFPTYDSEIKHKGHVGLKKLSGLVNLEDIQIILLPARKITEFYLNNEKIKFDKDEIEVNNEKMVFSDFLKLLDSKNKESL